MVKANIDIKNRKFRQMLGCSADRDQELKVNLEKLCNCKPELARRARVVLNSCQHQIAAGRYNKSLG